MGYGRYEVTFNNGEKIEAGYLVEDVCWKTGCVTEIDRGLGCLCGDVPGGDEYGCGGYFCGHHLFAGWDDGVGYRCGDCVSKRER